MKIPSYIFILIGIILLIGLFFILKPHNTLVSSSPPQNTTTNEKIEKKESKTTEDKKTFSLVIKNGEITSGEKVISIFQGEHVTVDILGDTGDEIHLHGYDISVDIQPNEHAILEFTADKTGRFLFELEHAGIELGSVEVNPK